MHDVGAARLDERFDAPHVGEPQGESLIDSHIALCLERTCDLERMAHDHDVTGALNDLQVIVVATRESGHATKHQASLAQASILRVVAATAATINAAFRAILDILTGFERSIAAKPSKTL